MARRDEPRLAVIKPFVENRCRQSRKQLVSVGEIQPAMFERQITLRRVECDNNYCTPNIMAVKRVQL